MLKKTLIKCAQLLDRDDLIDELTNSNSINEITNKQIKTDIFKLITYYNFITKIVYEGYVDLVREDDFISGADRKIYFNNFLFKPIKILTAKSGEKDEYFQIFYDYVVVQKPNMKYKIKYKFIPEEMRDFCDKSYNIYVVSDDVLAFGIVSQYLASKSKYNESEYFNCKFLNKLFNLKYKKERRLKSHFQL